MRISRSRFSEVGAVVAAGLSAAALGGCGGGDGGAGGGGASDRERMEQAALKHARCMREHGVDVPDPKPGGGGFVVVGPGAGGDGERGRRAAEACEQHLRDIPPPKLSEEEKTEMRDGALAHARCMREHGIDFPDPEFGPDGSISVELGEDGPRPDDPKMRAASEACSELLPRPGGDAAP